MDLIRKIKIKKKKPVQIMRNTITIKRFSLKFKPLKSAEKHLGDESNLKNHLKNLNVKHSNQIKQPISETVYKSKFS